MSLNSFAEIDPALIDVVIPEDGYPDHLAADDTFDALWECCGVASREFPESLWIEPEDWADKARDNDKYHTWGMNYIDRFTNQNPTHECTCHSLRANVEAARNRQLGIIFPDGPKKGFRYDESKRGSVWLSPLSVYAEANPRIRGGANVRQVLEIACRRGMLPEKIQPFDYGFEHTLIGTTGQGGINQSRGEWVPLNRFPEGWQETSEDFKPLEVVFAREWEQNICLMLHGMVDSCGREGHAVPRCQVIFKGNNLSAAGYPDSYDIVRYDSLATIKRSWQGAFSVISVTAPDNWSKPAE